MRILPRPAPLSRNSRLIHLHASIPPSFMRDWQYGCLDTASAVLANGRLTVRVEGVQPGGGFDVMLSEYAPDPNGSADVELGLYWRTRSAEGEGSPAPYNARAEVALRGMHAAVVRIYHASGFVDLRVRHGPAGAGGRAQWIDAG